MNSSSIPTTTWSLVVQAADIIDAEHRRRAMEELLTAYYPALRAYLSGYPHLTHERREDLVQSFLAEKVLENNIFAKADRERGRFRSFLLKTFANYVRSALRTEHADKRGPQDAQRADPDALIHLADERDRSPDQAYNLEWARQVLADVLERMHARCRQQGKTALWTLFEARLLKPFLEDAAPVAYEELVLQCRLESPSQAANLLITGKRMFKRFLAEVIRDTVENDNSVEDEIRNLKKILGDIGH